MSVYVSIADANTFFGNRLDSTYWDESTNARKTKALLMATKAIDNLNYLGSPTSSTQENQFPRNDDSDIPQAIKDACCLIASKLLEGIDPELEYENMRMISQGYANVRSTYDSTIIPEHTIHGIVSVEAWRLIKPYLRSGKEFRIDRV